MAEKIHESLSVLRSTQFRGRARRQEAEVERLQPLVGAIAAEIAERATAQIIKELIAAGFVPVKACSTENTDEAATVAVKATEVAGETVEEPVQAGKATPKKGGKTKEATNA